MTEQHQWPCRRAPLLTEYMSELSTFVSREWKQSTAMRFTPTIPLSFVAAHTETVQWDWAHLQYGHTWADILRFGRGLPWRGALVPGRPGFSWADVELFPVSSWDWTLLSALAPCQMVLQNPDWPWHWYTLAVHNPNVTWSFILSNPQLPWAWLHFKPGFSIDIAASHRDSYNWNWYSISVYVGLDDVLQHPGLPWDWNSLTTNRNIPLADILRHPELPWSLDMLEIRKEWEHKPNKEYEECWTLLRHCAGLFPTTVYKKFERDLRHCQWTKNDFFVRSIARGICKHEAITFQHVLDNPGMPWNWAGVSANPGLTWADVEAHPGCPWNWGELSGHHEVNIARVRAHLQQPWDWRKLSCNAGLRMEDIFATCGQPGFHWDWHSVSLNPNLTWEHVCARPDVPWDWGSLCTRVWAPNSSVSPAIIQLAMGRLLVSEDRRHTQAFRATQVEDLMLQVPELPLEMIATHLQYTMLPRRGLRLTLLSKHPAVSWAVLRQLQERLGCAGAVHECTLLQHDARLLGKCLARHVAAVRIQRTWRRAISDPRYQLCRRRLLAEYTELTQEPMEKRKRNKSTHAPTNI